MSLFRNAHPSRREVLKQSGMLTAVSAATAVSPLIANAGMSAKPQRTIHTAVGIDGDNLFTRIGVRPLINARGTYTIITGSRSLPQVKQAMLEASNYYVHLDESLRRVSWGSAATANPTEATKTEIEHGSYLIHAEADQYQDSWAPRFLVGWRNLTKTITCWPLLGAFVASLGSEV